MSRLLGAGKAIAGGLWAVVKVNVPAGPQSGVAIFPALAAAATNRSAAWRGPIR